MTTTREAFVATVRGYVGTKYHHQGRVPGVGLDCPGPLICACWEHGIKPRDFDVTGYTAMPDGKALQAYCEQHMQRVHWDDMLIGDVPLVRFQQGHPQHLGIVSRIEPGRRYWIEAEGHRYKRVLEARLVLTNRDTQLVGLYRVPGLQA